MPDTNLPQPACCKHLAVLVWEGDIMDTAGRRGLQHLCLQLLALQAITILRVASCTVLNDSHAHTSDWTRFEGHGHDCFAHKSGPAGKHEHCIAVLAVLSIAAATC